MLVEPAVLVVAQEFLLCVAYPIQTETLLRVYRRGKLLLRKNLIYFFQSKIVVLLFLFNSR